MKVQSNLKNKNKRIRMKVLKRKSNRNNQSLNQILKKDKKNYDKIYKLANNYNLRLNMLKGVLYFKLENLTARVIGPIFRRTGQSVYRRGVAFQGDIGHEDRLVPSLRCITISDAKYPRLLDVRRDLPFII